MIQIYIFPISNRDTGNYDVIGPDFTWWSPLIQGMRYIFLLWVLGLHDLAALESPEVLKGVPEDYIYESRFLYLHSRDALQIRKKEKSILGKNARFLR